MYIYMHSVSIYLYIPAFRLEKTHGLRGVGAPLLDHVPFVQHHSPPLDSEQPPPLLVGLSISGLGLRVSGFGV